MVDSDPSEQAVRPNEERKRWVKQDFYSKRPPARVSVFYVPAVWKAGEEK